MRLARLAGWIVAAAGLCAACAPSPQEAVRAYNRELVIVYRTGDTSRLLDYAADEESRKLRALVDLKTSQGLVLESSLESFRVLSETPLQDGLVLVNTEEKWRYQDRALNPGDRPGDPFVAMMKMEYTCVMDAGRWKVSQVRTLENRFLELPGSAAQEKAR